MPAPNRPTLLLCALLLCAGWLAAAPLNPVRPGPGEAVQRVPDRRERIDLVFPPGEEWVQVDHEAADRVETRTFEARRPSGDPALRVATLTVFHDLWDVDLEQAQHQFGRQAAQDCEGLRATLWSGGEDGADRRIVFYGCGDEGQEHWVALQLLLQGRDNFYALEVSCPDGRPLEGTLVRWTEFLKDVEPCLLDDERDPCPDNGIWSRRPR